MTASTATAHDFIEEDHVTGKPRRFGAALDALLEAARVVDVVPVIIGAAALAAHGKARYTEDIDVLLSDVEARRLVKALIDAGWKGPPPSRDVFLYVMKSPEGVEVDVMGAVEQLYEDVAADAEWRTFLGRDVRVPSASGYVVLKLRAAEDSPEDRLKHLSDALDVVKMKPSALDDAGNYVSRHEPDLREIWRILVRETKAASRPSKKRRKKK